MKGNSIHFINSHITIIVLALILQGCAVMGGKSNGDKLSALAGEEFIISTAKQTVDFDALLQKNNTPSIVMSLVPEQNRLAVLERHRGVQSISTPLTVADSSNAMVNSLAKYYQRQYQLKFIAKGTITNISPDYLNKALTKGRYVLDVRLTELSLVPNASMQRFYPAGSYQLSVIDAQKAKVVIQDTCSFSNSDQERGLAAFSANKGQLLSSFLSQHANDCLQYFARGDAKASTTGTQAEVQEPTPVAETNAANDSTAVLGIGTSYQFTEDSVQVSHTLQGYNAFYQINKPVTNGFGFALQSELATLGVDEWTDFSNPLIVVGLGLGASLESSRYNDLRYVFLAKAKMGQYRQQVLSLSTNSVGLEGQIVKVLFGSVWLSGRYGLDVHVGQTKAANSVSHLFGVSLGYEFGH